MPLDTYRRKRDFSRTSEPRGGRARSDERLTFVVQKHAAHRLHYDFRLELDGVLKSWAVPKEPSLDPRDRRLAVHVEDHPLEYATFEGTIPEGQYGAGTVKIWDRGVWIPQDNARRDYAAGKLRFTLRGKRLRGGFSLVRMSGRADNWLLIKTREPAPARPGRRARSAR